MQTPIFTAAVEQTAVARQASSAAEAGAFAKTSPVDATGQQRRQTRNDKQVVPTSITQSMEPSTSSTTTHLRRANSVAATTIVPTTVATTTSRPTGNADMNQDMNAQQLSALTESSPIATSKGISTQQKATSTLPPRTSAVFTTTTTDKFFTFTHLADATMWLIIAIVAGTSIMVTIAIVTCIHVIRVIHKWHTRGRGKNDESKSEQVAHEACHDISDENVERGGHR